MLTQTPTRPLVRYLGGKWKLAPWIISHFPPHKIYIEPFGGGASVLLRKPRVVNEIYNDLDGDIVNLFRMVRDHGPALRKCVELTPFARDEYDAAFSLDPVDNLDRARITLIKAWMGRGSDSLNKKRGFRLYLNANDRIRSTADEWARYPEALAEVTKRLQGVVIEHRDAFKVIHSHDQGEALIYLDPPYLHSTRGREARYKNEFTDSDHERLAEMAHTADSMIVLSHYPCALYDRLYGDWWSTTKDTYADEAMPRTEKLWLNPAAREALAGQTTLI